MSKNNVRKKSYPAVLASVKHEMAEPRIAESAHIEAEKQSAATVKRAAKP
jgi:hypothetical protein